MVRCKTLFPKHSIFEKRKPPPAVSVVSDSSSTMDAAGSWTTDPYVGSSAAVPGGYSTYGGGIGSASLSSTPSKCEELRRKIHQSHLAYLNMEDTPEKIDLRVRLQDYIGDLLALVPHKLKFDQLGNSFA